MSLTNTFSFSSQALWPHIWLLLKILPHLDYECFLDQECWPWFWPSNPYDAIYTCSQAPHSAKSPNADFTPSLSHHSREIRPDTCLCFWRVLELLSIIYSPSTLFLFHSIQYWIHKLNGKLTLILVYLIQSNMHLLSFYPESCLGAFRFPIIHCIIPLFGFTLRTDGHNHHCISFLLL